MLTNESDLG